MSKKKDFKGLTSSIVSNKVTSIDDFYREEDESRSEDRSKPSKPEPPPQKTAPKSTLPEKKLAATEEHEKVRVSLFLTTLISYELDELKMNIRRLAPRSDMSKISKSSIVEAAVDIVKADFENNGIDSELFKRILK